MKSLILRQSVGTSDTAAMAKQVSEMQGQLAAMEASATADTKSIVAQSAGYYSAVTDGYEEQLTPQVLEDITVSEFQDLWKQTPTAPGQTAGRLITSGEWYYACTVESRYLEGLETGDSLTVTLGGEVSLELEMTVTRVNREQELGLLVLASQDKLSSISALRRLNAEPDPSTPTPASGCREKRCATARSPAPPAFMYWLAQRRCGKTLSFCMTTEIPISPL